MQKNTGAPKQESNLEQYNRRLVNLLDEYLLDDSEILELGSGTAADLLKLSKHYQVVGTDPSKQVIEKIKQKYPELKAKQLSLQPLLIEGFYDCIYSDKSLAQLSKEELIDALINQADHLKEDGIILMSFPYGEEPKEVDGRLISRYTERTISELIPNNLRIHMIDTYSEEERKDSLLIILKKRSD